MSFTKKCTMLKKAGKDTLIVTKKKLWKTKKSHKKKL